MYFIFHYKHYSQGEFLLAASLFFTVMRVKTVFFTVMEAVARRQVPCPDSSGITCSRVLRSLSQHLTVLLSPFFPWTCTSLAGPWEDLQGLIFPSCCPPVVPIPPSLRGSSMISKVQYVLLRFCLPAVVSGLNFNKTVNTLLNPFLGFHFLYYTACLSLYE